MPTTPQRRDAWRKLLERHPGVGHQFGQSDDESTFNGATGCTHVTLQVLILAATGRVYSQDEISRVATYPSPRDNPSRRGMRWGGSDNEVGRVIDAFNLPYELWFPKGPLTEAQQTRILTAAERGPVMAAVQYSHYPEWRYYTYNGVPTDGKPNGYAYLHGKTQTYGFYGPHSTLFLGWYWNRAHTARIANMREPNHGSASRPEKPTMDKIKAAQLWNAVDAVRTEGGRNLAFALPTRVFVPR